jgi:ribonuclease Z
MTDADQLRRKSDFVITLLGTGTPVPRIDRFGPSTLIEAGEQKLLIDAGRGATMRLWQLGIPLSRVDRLLITHFHSDHTNGIPDLWLTGWLPPAWGRRQTPFRVIGPIGAKVLMSKLEEAYALDIKIRLEDEKVPIEGIATIVEEFHGDGVVFDQGGVKVIAFEVDHGDVIKPAYGYRIEYQGRVAVISGDTRYHPNVISYGKDADLLIHEVGAARPQLLQDPFMQRVMAHHTSPREAGMVFAQTCPKMAVFTHLVMLGNDKVPPMTLDEIVAETRAVYDGPLVVGEDLMGFDIGDTVSIRRPGPSAAIALSRP